jgi:hypothetical protein
VIESRATNEEQKYLRRRDISVELVDGEAFVWDTERQELHRLNTTTTSIWLTCNDWTGLPAIVTALAGGSGDVVEAAIVKGVDELCSRQLLLRRDAPEPS